MGRMTHQPVLADFIPPRRKGDAGNYWHLEMAMPSLLTTTQNALCIAVSDRQLVLKSTVPSLSAGAKDTLVSTRGTCGKTNFNTKVGYYGIHRFCTTRTRIMVFKLMFDICQTSHHYQTLKFVKQFFP